MIQICLTHLRHLPVLIVRKILIVFQHSNVIEMDLLGVMVTVRFYFQYNKS